MTARSLMIGAALVTACATAAPPPAGAQDLFTGILSAIGIGEQKDPIEYRERPPLVVPPKTELREPQARVERNGAWPVDPDAAARRQDRADRNAPVVRNENPMMSPNALRAGPRTSSNAFRGQPLGAAPENSNSTLVIGPTMQMRAIDEQRQQSVSNLQPGEEPERKSLAEPPRGYRKPSEVVRATADPVRQVDSSSTRDFIQEQRRN